MSANAKKYPLRFNSWTLGGHGADLFEKSAEALELERINPLRGVDEWRLGQIFDDARDGIFADLAWLYNEIEGVEPALVACCDMRESAASECGWLVNTADASRVRGFDQSLADDQRDALLAEFGAIEDDVAELAGHLTGAFFRGAAHALPLWNADGSLAGFRHLDLWNFAFDRQSGIWYWNADASRDENTFQPIPPGELVTLASTRHADHAALPIFIRAALGAKRYGVWLDRFGIPPVGVIMPPNAEKGEQGAYMDLARKFARGGSGILPNGSSVVYGTEARAVCPFIDFIRFQQQQIYLVGIGRVQSGETDGANLGGNAAGVVEDGFRRLVRRDARRIARAINDCVTRRVLARLFPGKPALAQFAWDTEAKRTAHEVLEDAGLAKSAGLAIDIDQLSELTGYKLEKAPETPQPGLFGGLNSDRTPHTPLQNTATRLQNAPKKPDGQGEGETPAALLGPFLSALKDDCKPLAAEVEDLLKALESGGPRSVAAEKARALLDKIPDLVPEDPALAPLLAEEMAKAYGEAFTKARGSSAPQEEAVNSNPDQPRGQPGNAGQFASTGGASGAPSETTEKTPAKPNPQNDGKIDFRGNTRAKAKADVQATRLGYAGIDDLMQQSTSVTAERIAEITAGADTPCKAHEAIAALRSHATIKPNASGEEPVQLTERPIRHYVCGERRHHGGEPSVARLTSLPLAIKAIRECDSYHHEIDGRRIVKMPGEQLPKGAQTIYERSSGPGRTKAFAYTDSGVLNGWQLN